MGVIVKDEGGWSMGMKDERQVGEMLKDTRKVGGSEKLRRSERRENK